MNELEIEKTMTVKEVAEVLGVTSEAIKKHIRELFPQILKNGVETYLTDYQVTEIKKKMLPTTQVVGSKTEQERNDIVMQAFQILIDDKKKLKEENEQLKIKNKEMLPKVEYFEDLCQSKDAVDIGTVAKILDMGVGRNQLFEILREEGILMIDNQPYQKYVDQGYFRVIESKYIKPDGSKHIGLKTVVFQTGINYIKTLLNKIKPTELILSH
jgi:phage antirepressor YoqD-like protein